ncbi:MAG: ARMT1-like domain-containing protein [candidate division WOR-3 bacterium]|nr:ARMT1-like domain-containing protein [candidate division WOR-3 bacterium]
MLTQLECAPCIIDDLVGAIKLLNLPREIQKRILAEGLDYLSKNFNLQTIPSYHITQVHRILKRISGIEVPFAELRSNCNKVGTEIANYLSRESEKLSNFDRFYYLARWAIAGNLLDFRTVGTGYGLPVSRIREKLKDNVQEGLRLDHTNRLYKLLGEGGRKILYILDNVGEIAIDKLLINKIVEFGNSVTTTVRGGPITSDATLNDAQQINLSESGARIIIAGPDTLGISWKEKSKDLADAISETDIVITKGQANFYVFSEYKEEIPGNIFCLFTTKCEPVSGIFGSKGKINLAVQLK